MIPNRLTGSFTTQRINFVGAPQCLKNQKVLFSESYSELGFPAPYTLFIQRGGQTD